MVEILNYEKDEEVAHIPIVALTANALKGDRERFLKEGMDEYITKPIETSQLLYILNKFLSDKSHTVARPSLDAKDTKYPKDIEKKPLGVQEVEPQQITIDDEETDITDLDTTAIEIPSNKILIAKKTLLERRILTKVLENLGYDYTILESMDLLEEKVKSGHYNILFADASLPTDTIAKYDSSLTIVTTSKTKEEINTLIQKKG